MLIPFILTYKCLEIPLYTGYNKPTKNIRPLIARCFYPGILDTNTFYDVAQLDYEFETISIFINNKKAVVNMPLVNCLEIKFKKQSLFDDE